ncbi:MAG: DNA recombination protein RmuC [Firmicutes bacterium]|nr:DNA recombination protein RmuC [Bacillota bacterium]
METALLIAILILTLASLVLAGLAFVRSGKKDSVSHELEEKLSRAKMEINSSTQSAVSAANSALAESQKQVFELQNKRLEELSRILNDSMSALRLSLEGRFKALSEENDKRLTEIRATVDEKLQSTLEKRLSQSFKEVSDRLEQVYKGLGEMQSLATGVGDLKKVLSNVKTRGILGEIQLGAILSEIMSPDQYEENIATVRGSQNRVEFAVKMPGGGDGRPVYLPIDSKFPVDTYQKLEDAYDSGDPERVKAARNDFSVKIRSFAKDIHDKYVCPPDTTDFAVMFLPTEGIYAEVLRLGLMEKLQSEFKINIAGPTTMAALLNSLRMGFKTLAIQKRSGEVWDVLSAVKTEFERFEDVLIATQNKLNQANGELDKLVGVRTRAIRRRLKDVSVLPENSAGMLSDNDPDE